ncbi:unnamed protein product, partial [Trichogramma brassicae]
KDFDFQQQMSNSSIQVHVGCSIHHNTIQLSASALRTKNLLFPVRGNPTSIRCIHVIRVDRYLLICLDQVDRRENNRSSNDVGKVVDGTNRVSIRDCSSVESINRHKVASHSYPYVRGAMAMTTGSRKDGTHQLSTFGQIRPWQLEVSREPTDEDGMTTAGQESYALVPPLRPTRCTSNLQSSRTRRSAPPLDQACVKLKDEEDLKENQKYYIFRRGCKYSKCNPNNNYCKRVAAYLYSVADRSSLQGPSLLRFDTSSSSASGSGSRSSDRSRSLRRLARSKSDLSGLRAPNLSLLLSSSSSIFTRDLSFRSPWAELSSFGRVPHGIWVVLVGQVLNPAPKRGRSFREELCPMAPKLAAPVGDDLCMTDQNYLCCQGPQGFLALPDQPRGYSPRVQRPEGYLTVRANAYAFALRYEFGHSVRTPQNGHNLCLEYRGQPTEGNKRAPTVSPPVVPCSRQPSGTEFRYNALHPVPGEDVLRDHDDSPSLKQRLAELRQGLPGDLIHLAHDSLLQQQQPLRPSDRVIEIIIRDDCPGQRVRHPGRTYALIGAPSPAGGVSPEPFRRFCPLGTGVLSLGGVLDFCAPDGAFGPGGATLSTGTGSLPRYGASLRR